MKNPFARLPLAKHRRDERDQFLRGTTLICRTLTVCSLGGSSAAVHRRRLPGTITCASPIFPTQRPQARLRAIGPRRGLARRIESAAGIAVQENSSEVSSQKRDYGAGFSKSLRSLDIRALNASSSSLPMESIHLLHVKAYYMHIGNNSQEIRR